MFDLRIYAQSLWMFAALSMSNVAVSVHMLRNYFWGVGWGVRALYMQIRLSKSLTIEKNLNKTYCRMTQIYLHFLLSLHINKPQILNQAKEY